MAAATEPGLVDAALIDLRRLHATWMELVYPRQRDVENTALGKWTPDGGLESVLYQLWSALGVLVVGIVYPIALFGFFVRFQTRKLNTTAVRLGLVGTVLLFTILWGSLSVLAYTTLDLTEGGVVAVVAASVTAIISSALSFLFWRIDGRFTTVVFAYPFAVTAVFLPPVVAAMYSEAVASVVIPQSDSIHQWLLDSTPVFLDGVKDWLVANFDLEGYAYVVLWFGISVPFGWFLGIVVTLADLVRPTPE